MAQQTINIGASPNDGTGTPLRTAFQYTNSNFSELYTAVGPSGNNIVCPGSATITGDLTVDTNTLKVDSANNRVGIGTASPATNLHVGSGVGLNNLGVGLSRGATTNFYEAFDGTKSFLAGTDSSQTGVKVGSLSNHSMFLVCNNITQLQIDPLGVFNFTDGAGGTRMTLNATGLGVGVTPSAWGGSNRSAIQFPGGNAIQGSGSLGLASFNNAYNNGTNDIYIANGVAYKHIIGTGFQWYTAPSGTAGNAITFTQAMTLDASGNLLVGKTARDLINAGVEILPSGQTTNIVASSVGGFTTLEVYSTTAAAYRFYVGMNGTISATNTVISAISDARLKENVQDIDVGLGAILALKPRKFDWKEGKGKDIKGDRGFIAQEFEQVFPQLVDDWKDAAPEGEAPYKSVRQDLIPVLVKAIQELTARVQTLETR